MQIGWIPNVWLEFSRNIRSTGILLSPLDLPVITNPFINDNYSIFPFKHYIFVPFWKCTTADNALTNQWQYLEENFLP